MFSASVTGAFRELGRSVSIAPGATARRRSARTAPRILKYKYKYKYKTGGTAFNPTHVSIGRFPRRARDASPRQRGRRWRRIGATRAHHRAGRPQPSVPRRPGAPPAHPAESRTSPPRRGGCQTRPKHLIKSSLKRTPNSSVADSTRAPTSQTPAVETKPVSLTPRPPRHPPPGTGTSAPPPRPSPPIAASPEPLATLVRRGSSSCASPRQPTLRSGPDEVHHGWLGGRRRDRTRTRTPPARATRWRPGRSGGRNPPSRRATPPATTTPRSAPIHHPPTPGKIRLLHRR